MIGLSRSGRTAVLTLTTNIDPSLLAQQATYQQLTRLRPDVLVLDLRAVQASDTTLATVLTCLTQQFQAWNGTIAVAYPNPAVQQVLRSTGADQLPELLIALPQPPSQPRQD